MRRILYCIAAIAIAIAAGEAAAQVRADLAGKFSFAQWDAVPISGDDPIAAFQLCAHPHSDSCEVLAWMQIVLPVGPRRPQSLDAQLAKWQAQRATAAEPAHRLNFNGQEAVEWVTRGEHSDHIHMVVVHHQIVFRNREQFVNCYGWSKPDEYFAFKTEFQRFCATFDTTSLKAG